MIIRGRSGAAGLDRLVGSRSDGRGCAQAASRRWAAGDGGGRRRAAAELAGETQSRFPVHGLACGLHLSEARELTNHPEAATAAEMRRGGRSTRRRVSRTPVMSLRAPWCTSSSTNVTGGLLTSKRSSRAASRRRNDCDDKQSTAAAARVCGRRRRTKLGRGFK
jgi:hypothetical protein